ncbi:MAG: SURF1 family cytochrome oxidase biogenesis protein [Caulobacteraceae bacterium]
MATRTFDRRPAVLASLIVLVAFVVLVGLGVWQVKRLHWKTALLHKIAALQAAPAEPIVAVLNRVQDGVAIDFVRVQADCPDIETTPALHLYSVYQGLAGYRLITACRLPYGPFPTVLVDRGFALLDSNNKIAVGPGHKLDGPITGILRMPDARNIATLPNQPDKNLWYWRDVEGMARALGAPGPVAPAYLMLESPAPTGPGPTPAPLPVNIPNNHLGYAITWFGLAVALAGVYLAMLFRRRPS